MTRHVSSRTVLAVVGAAVLLIGVAHAQNPPPPEKKSSYAPVDIKEDFASIMARMSAAKAASDEAADGPARRALRPGRPRRPGRDDVARQAVQDGVRVQAARRA